MIIKDYIIIDDVLKNPETLRNLAKEITFYTKTNETLDGLNNIKKRIDWPEGNWPGYRSDDVYVNEKLFHSTFDEIFNHILTNDISCRYDFTVSSYLHFSPETCKYDDSQIHTDYDCSFAGVIYLNENPPQNSGTTLYFNDNIINVENKYNRMLMYRSNLRHKVSNGFGTNASNSRLTLVFFITRFFIDIKNYSKGI